jgi:hypothetical protein
MAYQPHEPAAEQAFQTTTPLGIGVTYDSGIIDLRGWTQVDTRVRADQDGTLTIRWYSDAAGTNEVRTLVIPYEAAKGFQLYSAPAFTPFNRYEYTNGGVAQLSFFYETKLLHVPLSPQILGVNAFISEGMVTQLGRSIGTGQQPDGDFVNARADGTAFTDTTPLGAAGTFQSDWLDTDGFVSVELFIRTDEISAVNGIMVEFTDDVQAALPTVRASDSYTFAQRDVDRGYLSISFPTRLDGFRVTYTNGAAPQGSFFIQTDLRTNSSPIRLDQSGAVITTDFEIEVALGNIPNHTNGTKFGSVLDIGSGDVPVTIWRAADSASAFDRKTFQTAAANAWVCGTGAGTQQITLIVNNASNALQVVTVNLNGTTPVDTGVSVLDCNTAYVSGTDETLAGDVWITNANNFTVLGVPVDPTEVLAFIPQADQRTQQAVYRVPAGTTMVVRNIHAASAISTGQGRMSLKMRVKPPNGSWYVLRPFIMSTNFTLERDEVMTFAAGTLIEFYLDASANGSDTTVIFNYDLITGA